MDFAEIKAPARERVFSLLSDLKWHSWLELKDIGGVRYGARLLELRRLGYQMETMEAGDVAGGFEYRLLSTVPTVPQEKNVKVFISEREAEQLLAGVTQNSTLVKVQRALESFQSNKEKL